jgi:hypothetical protein
MFTIVSVTLHPVIIKTVHDGILISGGYIRSTHSAQKHFTKVNYYLSDMTKNSTSVLLNRFVMYLGPVLFVLSPAFPECSRSHVVKIATTAHSVRMARGEGEGGGA